MDDVRFRILGPVEVEVEGDIAPPGGRNARAVLLALLLDVNHAVPIDRLAWVLWPDHQPASAVHTIRAIVSRLRGRIGHERIVAVDHSYVLRADPGSIDAVVFERLIRHAAAALASSRSDEASDLADRAIGMWRGEPFGDLVDAEFARWESMRLEELRTRAMEVAYEAAVAGGRSADVLPRLEVEVEAAPYRERLWALLMRALAAEGRRVEALQVYERAAALLHGAGTDPGPELRDIEDRIRSADPDPATPPRYRPAGT